MILLAKAGPNLGLFGLVRFGPFRLISLTSLTSLVALTFLEGCCKGSLVISDLLTSIVLFIEIADFDPIRDVLLLASFIKISFIPDLVILIV
jgi:hypothetical protein